MSDTKTDATHDCLLGLHYAAITGNVGLVKFALDHGAAIDSVVNGFMPLQLACTSDANIAVVQYLIDRGANVNEQRYSRKHSTDRMQLATGATGSTALHVACANGCIKIVDLLLLNGAAVDVKDKYGSTPMDLAVAKHHIDIVKLLQRLRGRRSLDASCTNGSVLANRVRRPSLPAIVERQQLSIPPLSTIPPPPIPSIDIVHPHSTRGLPDLASSNGSAEENSTIGTPPRTDYYGQGVVKHYDDETYLQSLERRAYGLTNTFNNSNNEKKENHYPLGNNSQDNAYRSSSVESINLLNAAFESVRRPTFPAVEEYINGGFRQRRSWWKDRRKSVDTQSRKSLEKLSNASHKSIDIVRRPIIDGFMPLPKKGIDAQPRKSEPSDTEDTVREEDCITSKDISMTSKQPSIKTYFSRLWHWSRKVR